MVDHRLEAGEHTSLWPKTRRGAVLYALAAMLAVVVGVIPALWINRWRGDADAAPAMQAEPVAQPTVEPIEAAATPEQTPAAAPQPTVPTVPTIEMDEPTVPTATATTTATAKTTKRARPKIQRPKPTKPAVTKPAVTKPKPPPCDIYLHPHGCPN